MKKKLCNNLLFIFVISIFLIIVMMLNYFVDPYKLFFQKEDIMNTVTIPRELIFAKINAYKDKKYSTVIIGSSDIGIMFGEECFRKNNYDLITTKALNLKEYYELLKKYLELHPEINNVIVGINFPTLIYSGLNFPPFKQEKGGKYTILSKLYLLFSLDTTKMSLKKIKKYLERKSTYDKRRYMTVLPYAINDYNEKINSQDFKNIRNRNYLYTKKLIRLFEEKKINYKFFIPPYNAIIIALISEFENIQYEINEYKRFLVNNISDKNKFYDFGFANVYTSTDINDLSNVFYYTLDHPNILLGSKVYKVLFEKENKNESLYFILNKENINKVIKKENELISLYKKENKALVNFYLNLAMSVENRRKFGNVAEEKKIYEEFFSEKMKEEYKYIKQVCLQNNQRDELN